MSPPKENPMAMPQNRSNTGSKPHPHVAMGPCSAQILPGHGLLSMGCSHGGKACLKPLQPLTKRAKPPKGHTVKTKPSNMPRENKRAKIEEMRNQVPQNTRMPYRPRLNKRPAELNLYQCSTPYRKIQPVVRSATPEDHGKKTTTCLPRSA